MLKTQSFGALIHTCQHLEIRNQDTFSIALTPPATDQSWRKRKIEADRSCTALCTEIHEPTMHTVQIDKGNFYVFSILQKKDQENMTYVFKNYFKNRNICRLKFLKIWTSRFLEVLKVKNRDGWQVCIFLLDEKENISSFQTARNVWTKT